MAWRSCGRDSGGVSATVRDGIVALKCILGPNGRDASDFLVYRDLTEQVGQNRCIANLARGDLNRPDLQGFPVNS